MGSKPLGDDQNVLSEFCSLILNIFKAVEIPSVAATLLLFQDAAKSLKIAGANHQSQTRLQSTAVATKTELKLWPVGFNLRGAIIRERVYVLFIKSSK